MSRCVCGCVRPGGNLISACVLETNRAMNYRRVVTTKPAEVAAE